MFVVYSFLFKMFHGIYLFNIYFDWMITYWRVKVRQKIFISPCDRYIQLALRTAWNVLSRFRSVKLACNFKFLFSETIITELVASSHFSLSPSKKHQKMPIPPNHRRKVRLPWAAHVQNFSTKCNYETIFVKGLGNGFQIRVLSLII